MTDNHGYPHYPPPHGAPGQFGPPPGYPPYPSPHTAPPAQSNKRHWPWIIGAVAAAIVLTIGIVAALILVGGDDEEIATVIVTYELTGPPVQVEVAYWTSDGAQSEVQTVTLPWQTQVTKGGDNDYVSIVVQRAEASDEPLGCRITAEGVIISEDESVGISTTCGGRIGDED